MSNDFTLTIKEAHLTVENVTGRKVTEIAVRKIVERGKVKAVKDMGRIYVSESSLMRYIERRFLT